jgi:hypothetical protein
MWQLNFDDVPIFVVGLDSGTIVEARTETERLYARGAGGVVGRDIVELCPAWTTVEERARLAPLPGRVFWSGPWLHRRADHSWFRAQVAALRFEEDQATYLMVLIDPIAREREDLVLRRLANLHAAR